MNQAVDTPKRLESLIDSTAQGARDINHSAMDETEKQALLTEITKLLKAQYAVLVAHYYVDDELQDLADATGGTVADSLEMARFGFEHEAATVIVAGVKFMGETAKILSPEKRVLMPTLSATCSLDIGCPADEFSRLIPHLGHWDGC